jgi:phosphoserine phosphatase RsbU/P
MRILLFEDNEDDALFLQEILNGARGGPFHVVRVDRLATGLQRLAQGGIDVVLLDLGLPDSQGLETFLKVHVQVKSAKIPIVLLTGLSDESLAVKAVQKGAEDYLAKGQVTADSLTRTLRYAVERHRRRQAETALRETEVKLQAAREIQQMLFPVAAPPCPGFDIGGASYPAEATGGDYFDYVLLANGCLGIAIGDASGHGFGPALVIAQTHAYLRAFALTHDNVSEILALLNRALRRQTVEGNFVTLQLASLDPRTRTLVVANAGHPSGYILDPVGQVRACLKSSTFPLGVLDYDVPVESHTGILEPGELALFVTDGILEAMSPNETLFGVERTLDVVRTHRAQPARKIVDAIHIAVQDFAEGTGQADDITAVVIKVTGTT